MKLFVVGEDTPDPEKWSIWSELSLVIASDADEARRLVGKNNEAACEIPLDKAVRLVTMPEPNWGHDT